MQNTDSPRLLWVWLIKINMCRNCLKELSPNRGTSCLEKGSYLANFKKCYKCNILEPTIEIARQENTIEDGEETVTYTHTCNNCNHVIAEHSYSFSVVDGYQEYSMDCDLCGIGEASVSVLPNDPKKSAQF